MTGPRAVPGPLAFSGERPIALVTGGARRVGRAICLALASRGLDILLTFNASEDDAERTLIEARTHGVDARAVSLDLAEPQAVQAWATSAARLLPRLDVLIHNASTYEPSPTRALDAERAARQHRVNALSPLVLSAALADRLAESTRPGRGAIVAMLDIHAGEHPRPDHAAYAMSKAALWAMVRSLAVDLAPAVRVNAVAPGVVAWPETGPDADPDMQARYLARVPLGRQGDPEDAARAVAFLALDATYTTGHVLTVDGGRSLR
jgi:pteridine reductase